MQFATATQWVARLSEAKRQGNLETELRRLRYQVEVEIRPLSRYDQLIPA